MNLILKTLGGKALKLHLKLRDGVKEMRARAAKKLGGGGHSK